MTISHFREAKTAVVTGFACLIATCAVSAQDIPVPSGQPLSFLEFISEQDGLLVRFRFLTPQIGDRYDYLTVFPDFQALCDEQVVPVLTQNGLSPAQIVLSMSAADIPFGEDNPDVLQFFEIFRTENGTCIWEEF
ncbi:DUF6497 family protein [Pseudooctadecabacter sp.]|uniref:DUF6497 family protein n=1 Tax=Pseudooctadecabacter sp. TaxID=1966338 RepID=UPI00260068A4|nr:DUF6497 family protein [Pseudooctadecabacter sp.]